MAHELLLDTGAFVALVDRSERRHADCVSVLEAWTGTIVTTEAVLTEILHLVGPQWRAQKVCIEFLLRDAFAIVPSISVRTTWGEVPMRKRSHDTSAARNRRRIGTML